MCHSIFSPEKHSPIRVMFALALSAFLNTNLPAQNLVWAKSAGGSVNDSGIEIVLDGLGNSYVAGSFVGGSSFGSGEANQTNLTGSSYEIFIAKYNNNGNLVWAKRAGGGGQDLAYGIAMDGAGNIYITGHFEGSATFGPGEANQTVLTGSGIEIYVAKYNNNGELVWAKRAGSSGQDLGYGITADGSGNSYITGYFTGFATFGPGEANQTILSGSGNLEIFIAKYNSNGELTWAKRADSAGNDEGRDIAVDGAGNSYITGYYGANATFGTGEANQTILGNSNSREIFIAKYNGNGELSWAKRAGGFFQDDSYSIAVDGSGNSYVTGYFSGSATFGAGEANQTILSGNNDFEIFVAKYNSNGELLWAKRASAVGQDIGSGIALDEAHNSYVTGWFTGSATFGPGETNQTILSGTLTSVFVAKYNPNGALVWVKSAGGDLADVGDGIAVDGAGNSYVAGAYNGVATFGPGEAYAAVLSSQGSSDIFVAKYGAGQSDITVTPAENDYGDVELDSSSLRTFTVGNAGAKSLQVSATALTGAFADEFSIVSGGGPFTLAPLLTHEVVVSFNPTSAGSKSVKLRFTSDDPDENPLDISLTGRGVSADIGVAPNVYDFGQVGSSSSAVTAFAITNEGNLNLIATSTAFIGANAGEFSIESGGAPFTLPPGATHNVAVRFTPTSDGYKIATLRLVSNDPDENPTDVLLTGHGLGPDIEVEPSSHDYGVVGIGAVGYRAFEVKNVCYSTLNVNATTLTGLDAGEFSFHSGAAPFTLTPGAFHNVVVKFAPTTEGQKFAALEIASNDNDENLVEIFLTGKGVIEPVADIDANPHTLYFGSIGIGGVITQEIIVTNQSAAILTVSGTTLLGSNATDFEIVSGGGAFTLAPNGTRPMVLSFNPAMAGGKVAILRFTNNDPDENPLDVSLLGIAIGSAIEIVINEVVTDPQQDWNDSNGGNGVAFDDIPGNGAVNDADEWVELFNIGTQAVDLTEGGGWTLVFNDGTNATLNFTSPGSAVFFFSSGGTLTNFQPGEYLIIGNPPGSTNDNPYLVLRYYTTAIIDDVEIGNDSQGDGPGDGAPSGGVSDGNATGISDEAVARLPNGNDTNDDVKDFVKKTATIANHNADPVMPLITTAVADPTTPSRYQLENYPNPFNSETAIRFALPQAGHVALKIFNLVGTEIRSLTDAQFDEGFHAIRWDANDSYGRQAANGVYLCQLNVDGFSQIKKMILLR